MDQIHTHTLITYGLGEFCCSPGLFKVLHFAHGVSLDKNTQINNQPITAGEEEKEEKEEGRCHGELQAEQTFGRIERNI